jgi:hypothetical protein
MIINLTNNYLLYNLFPVRQLLDGAVFAGGGEEASLSSGGEAGNE